MNKVSNEIYIGSKNPNVYLDSCLFALSKNDKIVIYARGKHIKVAIDILARLQRKYSHDNYTIKVDNIKYNDRWVSEVKIEFDNK